MSQADPGQYPVSFDTQHVVRERAARLAEFHATLFVLTPRVFVTHLILIANVCLFLLMVVSEPQAIVTPSIKSLIFWGANYGPLTLNGQPWRLFTCMFVHIGIVHIAINMWILWDIGRLMERVVGNIGFALLYVTSGLCGSLASIVWNPHAVSAGASGAVFGLFGGLLGFLILGRGSMPTEISTSFRSSALTFVGYNLAFGFIVAGVDNAAHIGGLIGGCLCGLCLGQPLTLDASDYRWWKNLLVLVVGGGIVAAGLALLPKPSDVNGVLQDFFKVEKDAVGRYEGLRREMLVNKLTIEEYADGIENQVLPPWRDARSRLQSLRKVPPKMQPLAEKLVKYAVAREEMWDLEILASRDPTPERIAKFKEREQQTAAVLVELNQLDDQVK